MIYSQNRLVDSQNRFAAWLSVRSIRPLAALATVGALVGCGDAGSGGGDATGLGGPDAPLSAVTEDLYTVGAIDGEEWETFGNVSSVAFDRDGNLHIFDLGAGQVPVVAPDGSLLRIVGKPGEGPGEITNPRSAVLLSDGRVAVFEFAFPGSFEIFGSDGTHLETLSVDITKGVPGSTLTPLPDGGLLTAGGGRIRIGGAGSSDEDEEADEPTENRRPLEVFALDGSDPRTFYEAWDLPPAGEGEEATASDEAGQSTMVLRMARVRAFEPGLHFAVLSDGRVALADSTGWRVKLVDPDGSLAGTLERPIAPLPVTSSIADDERARRLEALTGTRPRLSIIGASSAEVPAAVMDAMRRSTEDMIFADEVPVIANLAVDWEDRIWVARSTTGRENGATDIATPAGEYVGTLPSDGTRIPDAFGPNGLMAYIESDDLGVQTVRVIRLVSLDRQG